METHTFTLIVEGPDLQGSPEMLDALFDAGCDDGIVGAVDGAQYVEFDREAETLWAAVTTAVEDIEAVQGITVSRIADAGLVSMAEIARRTGRTRESIRLLVAGERGPGGFPPPVTDPRNRNRLWRAAEVDAWMRFNLAGELDGAAADSVLALISAALEIRRHRRLQPTLQPDVGTLIGL